MKRWLAWASSGRRAPTRALLRPPFGFGARCCLLSVPQFLLFALVSFGPPISFQTLTLSRVRVLTVEHTSRPPCGEEAWGLQNRGVSGRPQRRAAPST